MAQRSVGQRLGYYLLRVLSRLFGVVLCGLRCYGRQHIPATGPALVCSNHQSYLDPLLIGLTFDRRLNYLARQGLFRTAAFGWLIRFLDAIPLETEGLGLSGLRESLRRLRAGELVMIFPEGSRTDDGSLAPLMPGLCLLARRAKVPLIPVGIAGAFEAWPRTAWLPKPARLRIVVGEPIPAEFVQQAADATLLAELEHRMRDCFLAAQAARRR